MATITIKDTEVYSSQFVAHKDGASETTRNPNSHTNGWHDKTVYINVSMDYSPAAQEWFPISEVSGFVTVEGLFVAIEYIQKWINYDDSVHKLPKQDICVFCRAGRNRSKLVVACLDFLQNKAKDANLSLREIYGVNVVNSKRMNALEDVLSRFIDRPFNASKATEMYYDLIL